MSGRPGLLLLALISVAVALPWISRAALQSSVPPQSNQKVQKAKFVPGEILVRFRKGALAISAARTQMSISGSVRPISIQLERLSEGPEIVEGLRLARVAPEDSTNAISALRGRSDVLYAEPNYIRYKESVPNDLRYPDQWELKNTGQVDGGGHAGQIGADIKAEEAWNITTGSRGIVVAVIDEGVDVNHPDLAANIWKNVAEIPGNGVDDDGNGFVDDVNGWDFFHNDATVFDGGGTYPADETDSHGTHVAGIIGATGNNAIGVVGVNWQVSLMSLKFLGPYGGTTSDLLKAFGYAGMMRDLWITSGGTKGANIRVLNNSYGGEGFSQAELDAIRSLAQSDILFVAAAGNASQNNDVIPNYPSGYVSPNVISVAATDRYDRPPSFTNGGAATVNIMAPGVSILSTTPNNTYDFFTGTSMASPLVAGAAALVCAGYPGISTRRLRAALVYSGDLIYGGSGITHYNAERRLNVFNALQNAALVDTTPPAAVKEYNIDFWRAPGDDGNAGTAADYDLRISDTDLSDPAAFELARPLAASLPSNPGNRDTNVAKFPYRHPSGFIGIRAIDKVGNTGPITAARFYESPETNDPYIVSESQPTALSTGGTPIGLIGDDQYKTYTIPFDFPFFKLLPSNQVILSTNGTLYVGGQPLRPNSSPGDGESSAAQLNAYFMMAGMWDDLRTDRRAGDDIYVVTPHPDRVIFRWQAVTFDYILPSGERRGENPVNFEIELRRDGTIQFHYGEGNKNLFSVVGLGMRAPDGYVVDDHTAADALKDLSNASTVTFSRRQAPQPLMDLDVTSLTAHPNTVIAGNDVLWNIAVTNHGPTPATNAVTALNFPSGTLYQITLCEYYDAYNIRRDCSYPYDNPPNNDGLRLLSPDIIPGASMSFTVRVKLSAGPQPTSTITATATANVPDSNPVNNSKQISIQVLAPNAIDDPRAFVRQHYLDFLNRNPDQGGWDFWTAKITQCGGDSLCIHNQRIGVSAAFYIELEFQQTGYVVYRFYRAAYGTKPGAPSRANITFQQFMADRAQLVGGSGLAQNTINLANNFVERPEFKQMYPDTMTKAEFVNLLFDTAGLAPYTAERQQQIDAMTNNGKTRAEVLRDVIEINAFKTREYNPAFVLMQYYGYLRRNPDQGGYDFWLDILTRQPDNFRGMVCSFLTSTEYQRRFGTAVTRSNQDCSQ